MIIFRPFIGVLFFSLIFAISGNTERPIRVLSIDGGGIRGLIPAVVLNKIEQELEKPIAHIFDLVVGSSTGGMIALGLTAPDEQGNPVQTAEGIVDFYLENGENVFKTSWRHWLKTLGGLIGPRYDSSGLKEIFNKYLGETMLSQAIVPTLITGYHIAGQVGVEFCSEDARLHPQDRDCLMREVALATSAAPVYFDAADVNFAWGKLESVADGCLYKLNPALLGYTQAKKLYPDRAIEVYSLGTGHSSAENLALTLKGRGFMHWMSPVLRHLIHGHMEADDAVLHKLLNNEDKQNYFRLNTRIEREHSKLDDISYDNLSYLYKKAIDITKTPTFLEMVDRLQIE